MHKTALLLLVLAGIAGAEVRPMTLRRAVETALRQNPDIALARLDEEKAHEAVRVARDPFAPRIAKPGVARARLGLVGAATGESRP